MQGIELFSFQIITHAGEARASFMAAVRKARDNDFVGAKKEFEIGDGQLLQGHKVHAELLHHEASGMDMKVSLLLVHAEDQLMNTETCKMNAKEFISLYERMECKE